MDDNPKYLAANLRFLMEKCGLNGNSLADTIGNKPPQATIFRILNGESLTPRDETLEPLAEFFGVPMRALRYEDLTAGTIAFRAETHADIARIKARLSIVEKELALLKSTVSSIGEKHE
jgi:transcriptional regulator with XRE-family HTH domain